jgi:peptidyl-prolyl cis-trans isomerase C
MDVMKLPNRALPALLRVPMVCAYIAVGSTCVAQAQTQTKPDPSPFAPGDLKRPIFDTTKRVYDTANVEQKSANTVVAEVDGRAITLGDVKDAIAQLPPSMRDLPFADLFPGVLQKLVQQQALVIRAQRQALDEDPAVRRSIKAATERIFADAQLDHEISRSITEAALLARYGKEIAGKPGPEEAHVRVIMLSTEKAGMDIVNELRGGADFATLAKRSSLDTTAPVGGDVGFVVRDGLTPEIGAVVFATPPGQFAPYPVRAAGGWYVLKVEERRQQPTPSFPSVREQLRQEMLHDGVVDVANAALADVSVREYDINGKETEASMVRSGSPEQNKDSTK